MYEDIITEIEKTISGVLNGKIGYCFTPETPIKPGSSVSFFDETEPFVLISVDIEADRIALGGTHHYISTSLGFEIFFPKKFTARKKLASKNLLGLIANKPRIEGLYGPLNRAAEVTVGSWSSVTYLITVESLRKQE